MAEVERKAHNTRGWYSRSREIELRDGTKQTEYQLTFETTDPELKRRIEALFQGIMDKKTSEK